MRTVLFLLAGALWCTGVVAQEQPGPSLPPPPVPADFPYFQVLSPNATFRFSVAATNKTLEVEDALFAKGTKVQQWDAYAKNGLADGKNGEWLLVPAGRFEDKQTFFIINNGFLKYLDVATSVTVQQGNGSDQQRWFLVPAAQKGKFYIQSVGLGTFLEMPAGSVSNGNEFRIAFFTGQPNQLFSITQTVGASGPPPGAAFRVSSQMHSAKLMTLAGATNGARINSTNGDAALANSQTWTFVRTPDLFWKIVNPSANKVIDVDGWTPGNGTQLSAWDAAAVEKQKWLIVPVAREQGHYIFFNKETGRCLDLSGAGNTNSIPLQTWLFVNAANQKWKLTAVR